CWLKWVGRDWSISADYIWLNYSGANIQTPLTRDILKLNPWQHRQSKIAPPSTLAWRGISI
ncbi:hypothetical protein, partial [Collinsella aerofaciens]|uniref:hypothetical protein n=1 Tax=Collinsella aerofaciens TaxID=74426 RepID=UPI00321A0CA3